MKGRVNSSGLPEDEARIACRAYGTGFGCTGLGMGSIARLLPAAGKSLTELMMVVAVVGIVAAMAAPAYQSFHARLEGRTVTAEIASTLRMARQLAMARRERLLLRFDVLRRTITLLRPDAGTILNVYSYADKNIVLDKPTAGTDLFFHPSGRSASASTIVIYDRERRRTIVTVSLTGRVVIS
jgi:type IV fimbrial biogenesis protein FimT